MKAHIFAGAVRMRKKYCSQVMWVTRAELKKELDTETFNAIKPLLAER
jgi:hypothetical protein